MEYERCREKARKRHTSLTFMLLCVPLPVWKTTRGKCSMSLPEMTWWM